MDTPDLILLILLANSLLIILVLGIFFLMVKRLVRQSPFRSLYERWPAPATILGKRLSRQHIGLNGMWFKHSATLIVAGDGLGISFAFPVSLVYKEGCLIPWKQIRYQGKKSVLWTDMYLYDVEGEETVHITVFKNIARAFPASHAPDE